MSLELVLNSIVHYPALKAENEFASERPRISVEKVSEAIAIDVVLNVAGIKVIEKVVNPKSEFDPPFLVTEGQLELSEQLQIE